MKLGLVLGSGAARGFAHIGVLQVLKQHGIDIHCIAGCSMGAVVGAVYATGTEVEVLEKHASSFKITNNIDLTFKRGGFIGGKRIERLVRVLTRGKHFEQTQIPFACVAVDYETGELVTFDKGEIAPAVRASLSMPGVFVPAEIDGKLYIDGGVCERMPCELAREMGADVILGVDTEYRGGKQPIPQNTVDSIIGMNNIMSWRMWQKDGQKPDILLVPDVFGVDPWTNKDSDFCIEKGKQVTLANIETIKQALK